MSTFNKLYNLILLSIITEDIESKIKKAIDILIKSGLLKDLNDPRILQIKTIIKRNNSIDINGKTKLDLLLKQNLQYINRSLAKKSLYLDNIKLFSLKKTYDKGVVIYKVELSRAGQAAVRKIIDAQWGEDANPWCLASRDGNGLERNYNYWKQYTAFPKHIAFQDGKLLAFCADSTGNCTWWDRQDKSHDKLPLLNGSYILTEKYEWSPELQKNMLFIKNDLKFNLLTKRYDCNNNLCIHDSDLVDGHFPIPFGVINGDFECSECPSLTSLINCPTLVKNDCYISRNKNLSSLIGAPKVVGGDFICNNIKVTSLEGAPTPGKDFYCVDCPGLKDLKGAPQLIKNSFHCCYCWNLKSLLGGPEYVGGNFDCTGCTSLTSFIGAPKSVKFTFKAQGCKNLKDVSALKNMRAKKVLLPPKFKNALGDPFKNQFVLDESTGMYNANTSIKITKDNLIAKKAGKDRYGDDIIERSFPFPIGTIKGSLDMRSSFLGNWKNSPRRIEKNFQLSKTNVKNMIGSPEYIGGKFHWHVEFPWKGPSSLEGAPKYINLFVLGVNTLTNLKGLLNTKINYLDLWCKSLTSLQGLSQQHFKYIGIHHNILLTSLKGLPDDVDKLLLSVLGELQNLDYLPRNLKFLEVFYCNNINLKMLRKLKQERPNLKIKYSGDDGHELL